MFEMYSSPVWKSQICPPLPIQLSNKKTGFRYFLDVVEYPVSLGSHGAAIFIFFLLLMLKLNGTSPDMSYWAVFAPLLLLPALFMLAFLLGIIIRLGDRYFSRCCPILNGQASASTLTCFYGTTRLL